MNAIKVETDSQKTILIESADVEVAPAPGAGGGSIAGGDELVEKLHSLGEVGDAIADVCKTLQDRINSSLEASKPSELTLKFGVTLAGEMGIPFVTKGSAEGTFQVTAKWDFSKE
ncbi:hypothetical protein Pan153_02120 [Gimesia panareensis]|uniref:Trypsin-co-occurring domain-containing protein n=1 Tax=Gimesia panareensis TaxID=2527978 RepID=A0A518FGY1_9PLAN|nr:CU044_2847 family protein [Gimesia panareensis]QDV15596.1 hypothetical protein Pan153_02120 [Gimesia panareensis]